MTTYGEGFDVHFRSEMTKQQFMQLCDLLSQKLNELYEIKDEKSQVKIRPEAITEGGFIFTGGPNNVYGGQFPQRNRQYKSMRINFSNRHIYGWPWITSTTNEEWSKSNDVLYGKGMKGWTFLKAFHDAPGWSKSEKLIFKQCFAQFNVSCRGIPVDQMYNWVKQAEKAKQKEEKRKRKYQET